MGYLLTRRLDGRPVEDQGDLARLDRADDTVIATREVLYEGRGNVQTDLASSDGRTFHLVRAGRTLAMRQWGDIGHPAVLAAAGMYTGAGNCGENASVALVKHAGKLAPNETAHLVVPTFDHRFVEVRTAAGHDHDVVVDAWCDGPATMAPDGRYSDESTAAETRALSEDELEDLAQEAHKLYRELDEDPLVPSKFNSALRNSLRKGGPGEPGIYPIPVLSDAYRVRADAHLNAVASAVQTLLSDEADLQRRSELRLELEAAGILMSRGEDILGAASQAADVVREARRLTQGANLM